jgi:hypothetical protein
MMRRERLPSRPAAHAAGHDEAESALGGRARQPTACRCRIRFPKTGGLSWPAGVASAQAIASSLETSPVVVTASNPDGQDSRRWTSILMGGSAVRPVRFDACLNAGGISCRHRGANHRSEQVIQVLPSLEPPGGSPGRGCAPGGGGYIAFPGAGRTAAGATGQPPQPGISRP